MIFLKKVTIYTLSTCPWCKKTKQFFQELNIDFESIDYDLADDTTQEKIRKDMTQAGAALAFPFTKINGKFVNRRLGMA